ncbi:hypothetical protein MGN70_013271 [Eutypa lata]|nr:hypothetical protein MGN70_013271 [Eutypa lata]
MAVDANLRFVQPEGLALAIIIVSLVFLFFSLLSVGIRIYIRQSDNALGLDDWLVLGGVMGYVADVGLAIWAASSGVGTRNAKLNATHQTEGMKAYTIWILMYVVCLALIKSSVCTTLLRIAKIKLGMAIAVWCLLGVVWASFMVTFIGVLLYCRPMEASWNSALVLAGKATCGSIETMIAISHTATVSTLLTDIGCTVLPGMLLWTAQMKAKAKLQVFGLLAVASVASVATIARAPFISHYSQPLDDLLYWVGYIVMFSNIELGIGCIASSLPAMRGLYRRLAGHEDTENSDYYNNSGAPRSHSFHNPTDTGRTHATVRAGDGDWEEIHDGDSDKGTLLPTTPANQSISSKNNKGGIRMDYSYTVELEPVSNHK